MYNWIEKATNERLCARLTQIEESYEYIVGNDDIEDVEALELINSLQLEELIILRELEKRNLRAKILPSGTTLETHLYLFHDNRWHFCRDLLISKEREADLLKMLNTDDEIFKYYLNLYKIDSEQASG